MTFEELCNRWDSGDRDAEKLKVDAFELLDALNNAGASARHLGNPV